MFDQTTVSPRAIVSSAGSNAKFLIVTVCARGAGLVHAATTLRSDTDAIAAQRTGERTQVVCDDWSFFAISRWAANAGRDFSSNALRSAFWAFGMSVLSSASSTAWW